MNILIAIPSPDQISPSFALGSLPSLMAYTKRNVLKEGDNLFLAYRQGVRTDRNRNELLKKALEENIDYILWLDADMLYPEDMIEKFLAEDFDIIGCLYFKRGYPFSPVCYYKGNNPNKPFIPVDIRKTPKDAVLEVDGLGYGGMMVKMSVYNALGSDKWTNYGMNYHLPFENDRGLTHDLEFCKLAKEKYGFSIKVHTGVEAGHLCEVVVDRTFWNPEEPIETVRDNINTAEYWDNKYTQVPSEYSNAYEKQTARWDEALKFIEPGDGVLDIGCGIGSFLRYVDQAVYENGVGVALAGIDISGVAIEATSQVITNGRLYISDVMELERLPVVPDVVFCGETLEHVEHPEHIFKLAAQDLKSDGRFIVTVPNGKAYDNPEHIQHFSEQDIKTLMENYFDTHMVKTILNDSIIFAVGYKH